MKILLTLLLLFTVACSGVKQTVKPQQEVLPEKVLRLLKGDEHGKDTLRRVVLADTYREARGYYHIYLKECISDKKTSENQKDIFKSLSRVLPYDFQDKFVSYFKDPNSLKLKSIDYVDELIEHYKDLIKYYECSESFSAVRTLKKQFLKKSEELAEIKNTLRRAK